MADGPVELPGGQDDEAPSLRLVLKVCLVLFSDVDDYLREFVGDPADPQVRIGAVSRVLRRVRDDLGGE